MRNNRARFVLIRYTRVLYNSLEWRDVTWRDESPSARAHEELDFYLDVKGKRKSDHVLEKYTRIHRCLSLTIRRLPADEFHRAIRSRRTRHFRKRFFRGRFRAFSAFSFVANNSAALFLRHDDELLSLARRLFCETHSRERERVSTFTWNKRTRILVCHSQRRRGRR